MKCRNEEKSPENGLIAWSLLGLSAVLYDVGFDIQSLIIIII